MPNIDTESPEVKTAPPEINTVSWDREHYGLALISQAAMYIREVHRSKGQGKNEVNVPPKINKWSTDVVTKVFALTDLKLPADETPENKRPEMLYYELSGALAKYVRSEENGVNDYQKLSDKDWQCLKTLVLEPDDTTSNENYKGRIKKRLDLLKSTQGYMDSLRRHTTPNDPHIANTANTAPFVVQHRLLLQAIVLNGINPPISEIGIKDKYKESLLNVLDTSFHACAIASTPIEVGEADLVYAKKKRVQWETEIRAELGDIYKNKFPNESAQTDLEREEAKGIYINDLIGEIRTTSYKPAIDNKLQGELNDFITKNPKALLETNDPVDLATAISHAYAPLTTTMGEIITQRAKGGNKTQNISDSQIDFITTWGKFSEQLRIAETDLRQKRIDDARAVISSSNAEIEQIIITVGGGAEAMAFG